MWGGIAYTHTHVISLSQLSDLPALNFGFVKPYDDLVPTEKVYTMITGITWSYRNLTGMWESSSDHYNIQNSVFLLQRIIGEAAEKNLYLSQLIILDTLEKCLAGVSSQSCFNTDCYIQCWRMFYSGTFLQQTTPGQTMKQTLKYQAMQK